ncbi:MAG: hypothetical protein ACREHG_06430 [Candidatus Saccharimonadales bacterium]
MLKLSDKWIPVLTSQPETGMGYQIASVILRDGRKYHRVMIVGGYITRVVDSDDIPFRDEEIQEIIVTHER